MPDLVYQEIRLLEDGIRLLHINPAVDVSAPLVCQLHPASLADNPQYEALSYVWGKPGNGTDITLNGTPFWTQENAEAAIRTLRYREQIRVIWIDAICIDQKNDEERGQQVLLMKDIYGKAERVCVWLGELTDTSIIGIKFLRNAINNVGWHQFKTEVEHAYRLSPSLRKHASFQNRMDTLQEQRTGELRELLDRPWWKRVWVIQEAVLARKIVIMCGPETLEWDNIDEAISLHRRNFVHGGFVFGLNHNPISNFPDEIYRTIRAYREKLCQSTDGLTLLELLYNFRHMQCTDPRDRIYAFLGLVPTKSCQGIRPDYGSPTAEVYRRFARQIIEISGALDVFNCKRELPAEKGPNIQQLAYRLLDQAKYHDTDTVIFSGPGNKPHQGWARLPQGWERKPWLNEKACLFVNNITGETSDKSPLENGVPVMAQNLAQQRRLPEGWFKNWDNLGRAIVQYGQPPPISGNDSLAGLESNPSWAPNWARATRKDPAPFLDWSRPNAGYWASGKGSVARGLGADDWILPADGVVIDHVEIIAPPWHPVGVLPPISRKGIEVLEAWEALAIADVTNCPYYGDRKNAIWRTMIADYAGDQAAPKEDWAFVETWNDRIGWAKDGTNDESTEFWDAHRKNLSYTWQSVGMLSHYCQIRSDADTLGGVQTAFRRLLDEFRRIWNCENIEKKYGEYLRRIHRACAHRALFVTGQGYIGLAPWNAEVGDSVAVLDGGKTPFLLRPASPSTYTLVGETYIYGIMGGEILKRESASSGKRTLWIV